MQDQETREALNTLLDSITDKVRSAPEPEREALLGGAMTMLRDMAVQQGLDDGQAGGWAAEIEQEVRQRLAQRGPGVRGSSRAVSRRERRRCRVSQAPLR